MHTKKSEGNDDLRKPSHGVSMSAVSGKLMQEKEKYVITSESSIEWSNLIFLPFHPVFRMLVLVSVFLKAMMGPIQSVYPVIYCNDVMDYHPVSIFVKYSYWYFCDSIYGIDTFLHIVHRSDSDSEYQTRPAAVAEVVKVQPKKKVSKRKASESTTPSPSVSKSRQVVDKAMRREHLPKSALLLMFDLLSLIPFFRLIMTDPCPPARLWPNILAYNEFLVIYRVTDYFQIQASHSYPRILIGYTIVMVMCINCLGCFWLLLTNEGFCELCRHEDYYYDWRAYVMFKLNETDEGFTTYVYSAVFVYSFAVRVELDAVKPSAILEFIMTCLFMIASYVLAHFIVIPKAFGESMLRFRRISKAYPIVQKIIDDTKRRNPSDDTHEEVERNYKLLWRKRSCILNPPEAFLLLPRYLRLDIKLDLLWPLFYHSPTLRKTSQSFRRWISESTMLMYKLPGEKFFTGPNTSGNLYFIKSGIVQLISLDDGVTPILSVTDGTIFGDINFLVPYKRKIMVRCLTYCEIYYIGQKSLLQALHIYPYDRKIIMKDANRRIAHAKALFANKRFIRGLDRNEDEGIAWIKRRWWEISSFFETYTKRTGEPKEALKGDLPREENQYHCAKYIGQLVLSTSTQLQTKSMFTNFNFPWILNPQSSFGYAWHRIISIDVLLVVYFYPQYLIRPDIPNWFEFFSNCSDTVYIIDLGVSLITAVKKQDTVTTTFAEVMLERFKSFTFITDLLATVWIEDLAELMGAPEYYYTLQFNRLLKIYKLFYGDYLKWDIRKNPILEVSSKLALIHFCFTLISSHAVFELINYYPNISMHYFFGDNILCSKSTSVNCVPIDKFFGVSIAWTFEWIYSESMPQKLIDIYVMVIISFIAYVIYIFSEGRMISYVYLKNSNIIKFQDFVYNLKSYYERYRIHKELLTRLENYLNCHWQYYTGTDVLNTNNLHQNQPYEVYWKAQAAVAQRTIAESKAFTYVDPELLKELACAARYLLMPKNSVVYTFGALCKNAIWVVQGYIKSEYYNEKNELVVAFHGPGKMLSVGALYFKKGSLRTYMSYTDCEIVYIKTNEFFEIYKKYPVEYQYVQNCLNELESMREGLYKKNLLKHRDYHTKLRDRIYSTRMSMVSSSKVIADIPDTRSLPFEGEFWGDPESGFMRSWMLFRTIIVCFSITSASLMGGVGAVSRWIFMMTSTFFDCIAFIDIIVKLCLPFYNDKGLPVTDKKKCLKNYLSRGFILDIVGSVPWYSVLRALLSQEIDDNTCFLINTLCKFTHIYIMFAYFEYVSDVPTVNTTSVMILKWQIVNVLIVMGASHYLMINCVNFKFNEKKVLIGIELRNQCWMPEIFRLPFVLDKDQLHLIFAESLNFAESGLLGMNFGRFLVDRSNLGVGSVLFALGLLFWFISCYTLTLLVLNSRGNTVFQYGVHQLEKFLKSERVEKHIIENVKCHFTYNWLRTKGINVQELLSDERIGVLFRHDLNYYFYKKTYTLLDGILGGGESISKQLAAASDCIYLLPEHEVFREMDISDDVFVVHRGKVKISKGGKKIIVLTKGDIFGQLQGTKLRPVNVSAISEDHVDLLTIKVPIFQSIITNEIRETIASNRQSRNDFMASKKIFVENPYDTVQYILRGRKTILLPGKSYPYEARHGSWYARWLYLIWFVSPYISSSLVCLKTILPAKSRLWFRFDCVLFVTDVFTLINMIAEFYTIDLIVERKKCVYHRQGVKKFKDWNFYLDLISILLPLVTLITNDWEYQLARLLRLKYFKDYEYNFCRSFQSRMTPTILKFGIVTLMLHIFTCGWIFFACRDDKFPIDVIEMRHLNLTIDFSQWSHPDERLGGCARVTRNLPDGFGGLNPSFVVPNYWPHDYVVAMTYILFIHTRTSIDAIMPLTLHAVYYKVFVTFLLYLLHLWISASAINYVYTKYRELFYYDYNVDSMLTYLTNAGLCKSLQDTVLEYSEQVWKRQKGDYLPEIAYQAPYCLRQDIFSALYIHHLESAPTFRHLPDYFKRQLAARLKRIIIFPGKCIVRAGDTFSTTYFIHQGEVEKWFVDSAGESQMMSVLYTNGYFGCTAGVITNASFLFSYFSRTVVDLVYLNLEQWEDLLDCYPEVKVQLHNVTKEYKKEFMKKMSPKQPGDTSDDINIPVC